MGTPSRSKCVHRFALVVAAAALATACQGMDRLDPDRVVAVGSAGETENDRGTLLDATSSPEFGGGGRLTEEIAARWVRQVEGAGAEERLQLAAQFLREYPGADVISYLHELVGDARSELGQPAEAAAAWQRAITMSWPAPDILRLPLTNLELPSQVGWAHFEAGAPQVGADWLVRATFVSDRPQLEQGLRFVFTELGSPADSFAAWFRAQREKLAVEAPDFELPGYQSDALRLSEAPSRLTLINFWTPT